VFLSFPAAFRVQESNKNIAVAMMNKSILGHVCCNATTSNISFPYPFKTANWNIFRLSIDDNTMFESTK
jgi:hypothetical protein